MGFAERSSRLRGMWRMRWLRLMAPASPNPMFSRCSLARCMQCWGGERACSTLQVGGTVQVLAVAEVATARTRMKISKYHDPWVQKE